LNALRADFTLRARNAYRPLYALNALRANITLCARNAYWPLYALNALRAYVALRASNAYWPLKAHIALWPGKSLRARQTAHIYPLVANGIPDIQIGRDIIKFASRAGGVSPRKAREVGI
jgi:hypothetical protein